MSKRLQLDAKYDQSMARARDQYIALGVDESYAIAASLTVLAETTNNSHLQLALLLHAANIVHWIHPEAEKRETAHAD